MEIQSKTFGDSITLYMEGCSVEFYVGDGVVKMNFHSILANKNPQNVASTNAHMTIMITELISQGFLNQRRY